MLAVGTFRDGLRACAVVPAAAFFLMVMSDAQAVDAPGDADIRWGGEVELGYVRTTGNTDIENIVLKAKVENARPRWAHELRYNAIRNEDSGRTTAKNSFLQGQSHYKWSDRQFGFATARYEQDDFAGYDYRLVGSVGIGRKILHEEDLLLELEIGAGGRKTAYIDTGDVSEAVGRVAGKFKWQLSETSEFLQELYSEIGEDNAVTDSLSELKVKVIGQLAVKMSVRVTHNTDVPPDTDKTDVKSAVTVVYDF